jgi:hypothetical protein
MKSKTIKKIVQDKQKISFPQVVQGHIPDSELEHKTTTQDSKSVDLTLAMYQGVLGQPR